MTDATIISIRFYQMHNDMPPIGALTLSASLEKNGFTWKIIDTQKEYSLNHFEPHLLVKAIRDCDSPILCFSIHNDAIPLLVLALNTLKNELKQKRIFVGGTGVTGIARDLIQAAPLIEAVVVGEGETILPILINDPNCAAKHPGVFTVNSGSGKTPRENLNNAYSIPWEWCRGKGYSVYPLSTMRGCSFNCMFCTVTAFLGKQVKYFDLDKAIHDLTCGMNVLQTNNITVLDDNFTTNKARVLQFCDSIIKRKITLSFSIYSRTDTIDENMMKRLAEAGCKNIYFGIDGGNKDVLNLIGKGVDLSESIDTVKNTAKYFNVTASFIWGYPFETLNAFKHMIKLARELWNFGNTFKIAPQFHLLSPSAGTPIFKLHSQDLILDYNALGLFFDENPEDYQYNEKLFNFLKDNLILSAPYYRYKTPDFKEKLNLLNEFHSMVKKDISLLILKDMKDGCQK